MLATTNTKKQALNKMLKNIKDKKEKEKREETPLNKLNREVAAKKVAEREAKKKRIIEDATIRGRINRELEARTQANRDLSQYATYNLGNPNEAYAIKMAGFNDKGESNYINEVNKQIEESNQRKIKKATDARTQFNKDISQYATYNLGNPYEAYAIKMAGFNDKGESNYINEIIKQNAVKAAQAEAYNGVPRATNEKKKSLETRKGSRTNTQTQPELSKYGFEGYKTGKPKEGETDFLGRFTPDYYVNTYRPELQKQVDKGMFDNGSDYSLMSDFGLGMAKTTSELKKLAAKTQGKSFLDATSQDIPEGRWVRVFDYLEKTKEGNLGANGVEETPERARRRQEEVEKAADFFSTEFGDYLLEGLTPEESRMLVYNRIAKDDEAYDLDTAGMNEQEKSEFDSLIDAAIERASKGTSIDAKIDEEKYGEYMAVADAWEQQQKAIEKEQQFRKTYKDYAGMTTGHSAYDPSLIPEPSFDGYYMDDYVPQGTRVQKAYYYANNPTKMVGPEVDRAVFMPDEMKDIFNDLFYQDIINGTKTAEAFLDAIDQYLVNEKSRYVEYFNKQTAEHPIAGPLARAATYPVNVVAGITGSIGTVAGAFGGDAGKKDSPWFAATNWLNTIREQQNENADKWVAENLGEWTRGKTKFLLGVADSIGDNLMAMGTAKSVSGDNTKRAMGLIQSIMSGEATSGKMAELLEKNVDPTEAAVLSVGSGIIEWVTERVSLEALLNPNVREMLGNKGQLAKYLLKTTASEGSEEIAADLLNAGLDTIVSGIAGHENELINRRNELIREKNLSPKDAERQAMDENLVKYSMSGLAGALSGFALGAGRVATNVISNIQTGENVKKSDTVMKNAGVNDLISAAEKMGKNTQSAELAAEIKADMEAGKEVSNRKVGKLAQMVQAEVAETFNDDKEAGKLTEKQAKSMAEAYDVARNLSAGNTSEGVNIDYVQEQMATEDEIWQAEGTRTEGPRSVVVDGEWGTITGVKDGKFTVDVNGTTKSVDASDIGATNFSTAAVIRMKTRDRGIYSDRYVNKLLETLDKGNVSNVGAFLQDAERIRWAAYMRRGVMPQTRLNQEMAEEIFLDSQRELAEELKNNQIAFKGKGKGTVTFQGLQHGTAAWNARMDELNLSEDEKQAIEYAAAVAKEAGIDLTLQTAEEAGGDLFHGSQRKNNISLNLQGLFKTSEEKAIGKSNIVVTMSHEMTHWLQQHNAKAYNELVDFVLRSMEKEGRSPESRAMEIMRKRGAKGVHLTMSEAIDEIVANSCDQVLGSQEAVDYFQQNHPGLFNQIKDYVKDVISRIKQMMRSTPETSSRDARIIMAKYGNELSKLWLGGIDEVLNGQIRELESQGTQAEVSEKDAAKLSMAEVDDQYMKAVDSGDIATQQRLIDEAADRSGHTDDAFHGSDAFGFTDFDLEKSQNTIFVAYNVALARTYTDNAKVRNISDGNRNFMEMTGEQREEALNNSENATFRKEKLKKATYKSQEAMRKDLHDLYQYALDQMDGLKWEATGNTREDVLAKVANESKISMDELEKCKTLKELAELMIDKESDAYQNGTSYFMLRFILRIGLNTAQDTAKAEEAKEKLYNIGDVINYAYNENYSNGVMEMENVDGEKGYISLTSAAFMLENMDRQGIYRMKTRPGNQLIIDANRSRWNELQVPYISDKKLTPREVAEWAREHNYNSVRINNVYDYGGKSGTEQDAFGDIGIFFNKADVKSGDLVTYGDDGEVIKPSERFKDDRTDIRYSMADEDVRKYLSNWADFQVKENSRERRAILRKYGITEKDYLSGKMAEGKSISRKDAKALQNLDREIDKWENEKVRAMGLDESDLGAQYVTAWKHHDVAKMEQLLMDKMQGVDGIIAYKAPNWYSGYEHQQIAKLIKDKNPEAIMRASIEMAQLVPENAVLIPMPPHTGKVTAETDTMVLAEAISQLTGRPVLTALEGAERERRFDSKENKSKLTAEDLGFRQVANIPEGMVPYFIDNVVGTGVTAKAAHDAIGHGITLAYAKSSRAAMKGLKDAAPTFYDKYHTWLIPLEMRMDMDRTGVKGLKYSVAENEDFEQSRQKYKGKTLYKDSEVYDYDFLVSLPDISVMQEGELKGIEEKNGVINRTKLAETGLENAYKNADAVKNKDVATVTNLYTGRKINLSSKSYTHGTHNNDLKKDRSNARVGLIAGELARNAVPINGLKNEKNIEGTYAMAAPVLSADGKFYKVAILTVEVRSGDLVGINVTDQLHAVSARKMNGVDINGANAPVGLSAGLLPTVSSRSTTIKISKLLDFVKTTSPSILSDSVLEHYGIEKPKNGYWSDRVLFFMAEADEEYDKALASGDTAAQQRIIDNAANEALKDSQVRYDDNELIRVYHGTKDDFTVFDPTKKGGEHGRAEGFGIYLTDRKEISERYGSKQLEGYADIKRIAYANKVTFKRRELINLIKATCEQQAAEMEDYASKDEAIRDTWISNYVNTYDIGNNQNAYAAVADLLLKQEDSDQDIIQEIMSGMGIRDYDVAMDFYHKILTPVTGFDGMWTTWNNSEGELAANIFLIFKSNQFKSAAPVTYDDKGKPIPPSKRFNLTEEDIRYSTAVDDINSMTDDDGNHLYNVTEEGTVSKYSYTSYVKENDRDKLIKYLKKMKFSQEQIDKWIGDLDDIAARIADEPERLDYTPDRDSKFRKPNGDVYKWTLDASTLCAKRLLYQGTFNEIQKLLPNTPLRPGDLIDLANMMHEKGYQTPCGICYVESRRRHTGNAVEKFLEDYQGEYKPNYKDLATTDGLAALKKEHRDVYDAFIKAMNKRGAGSVKIVQLRTDYRHDLRSLTKKSVDYLNRIGGIRIQSFSDFETPHMLDLMQAVVDMQIKGLKSQAYTKVPNFAWVFGGTGIKINLSLMGAGEGVDENGKLIFSDTEGMAYDEAMKLRQAYSRNVGTILVGMNRKHILAAMADPTIDFIIPFHKSGWSQDEFDRMTTLRGYEDFEAWQNERTIEGYTKDGEPIYKSVGSNIDPLEYWNYDLTGKENAQIYLDECAKRGIVPKFNNFLVDNGDGSWSMQEDGSTDGYWKTLIDFKMYDNDGVGARQEAVTPNFNMDQAKRVLSEYEGGADTLPVAKDVVREYVRKYKKEHPLKEGQKYSMAEPDGDDDDEINRYAMAEQNLDISTWMEALTPGSLRTESERQMLQHFKELRGALNISLERQRTYRRQIAEIERRETQTPDDQKRLTELRNRLQIQQEKQERLEDELYKATSDEGFARMMRDQERILEENISGRTMAEVDKAADELMDEAKKADRIMKEQERQLSRLAENAGVKTARGLFRKMGLTKYAGMLKKNYNTSMEKSELENRMAEIAMRKLNGEKPEEDIQSLAEEILTTYYSAGSEEAASTLNRLRGITITIGPGQQAELKGQNSSMKELRSRIRGSGIKLEFGDTSTLDTDAGDIIDLAPGMRDKLGNEKDALENFIAYVEDLLKTRRGSANEYGVENQEVEVVLNHLTNLMIYGEENDQENAQRQIEAIRKSEAEASKLLQEIRKLQTLTDSMVNKSRGVKGWTTIMRRDMGTTIEYYDKMAMYAAEAARQQMREGLIEQLKHENTRKLVEQQSKYEELIKNDKKARDISADNEKARKRVTTVAKRLKNLLTAETDQKYIPEEAKPLARMLSELLVNHDLGGFRKILYAGKTELQEYKQKLDAYNANAGKFDPDNDLDWLVIGTGPDADYTAHDKVIQSLIDIESGLLEYRTAEGKGLVTLQDRKAALQKVQKAVSQIYSVIQARRNAEIKGRTYAVKELASQMYEDMEDSRFKGERGGKIGRALDMVWKKVGYGNMTPEYFFASLKNKTMTLLHNAFHEAENRGGLEAAKAKARLEQIAKETGYASWDGQKKHTVHLSNGQNITMTTEQIMSLYATWKRESSQLRPEETAHLLHGGFVLAENDDGSLYKKREKKNTRPIRMKKGDLEGLAGYMTEDQIRYVDAMVDYLSTDLAELGNEASMKMYGLKRFTEKFYFPIRSWSGVLNTRSDAGVKNNNENRSAQQGFTKRLKNNAANAIEIGDFTPTAIKHIVGMINYNTVAPAVENLNKVLNSQQRFMGDDPKGEEDYKMNLRALFRNVYGQNAADYLATFMDDVNGGVARRDDGTLREKLLSVFKKNAVAGSLSVAAQQPLSYIRAAMEVNPKYLAAAINPKYWKGSFREMMEHSGVAVIKDMGKFDMNYGRSMQDYITPEGMTSTGQKIKGKLSDIVNSLPQKMDAMTWTRVWTAVKLEQHAANPEMDMKSDAFLDKVAERFNEVMRRTQVYDSVMVKSQNMRSNNYLQKVATSFMAEPTLSINVLANAWRNIREKGGKKEAVKALVTFLMSAAAQAGVKAFFGAGRTPDKQKTKEENFLNKLAYNLTNEMNPLGMVPGYNQLMDAFMNGELKDDAMGMIGKAVDVYKNIRKLATGETNGTYRALEDSVGQLVQLSSNVPLKNIMRDFRAMVNFFSNGTAEGLTGDTYANRNTSNAMLKYQAWDTLMSQDIIGLVNKMLGEAGYGTTNNDYYQRIYNAEKAGNKKTADEMKEYMILKSKASDPEKQLNNALKKLAVEDTSLSVDEKAKLMAESTGADPNSIWWTMDRAEYEKETGTEVSGSAMYYRLTDAVNANSSDQIKAAVKDLMDHGVDTKKIKNKLSDWKTPYLEADADGKRRIRDALEKAYKAIGLTPQEADKMIDNWKEKKKDSGALRNALFTVAGTNGTLPKRAREELDMYKEELYRYTEGQLYGAGNIDLNHRKVVQNDDGSISTERSFSFWDEHEGKEILIPTVVNGRILSEDEAIEYYYNTGKYLGKFTTIEEAEEYAEMLHERQDWYYHRK